MPNAKTSLIIIALVALPLVMAFSYDYGENKTIYPRCFNATDGELLGTTATLTVRNETGIYYSVSAVENIGAGLFKTHISNLSLGHCYSLDFNCTAAGAWGMQWETICVNSSTTSSILTANNQGYAGLGGVVGLAGMVGLFVLLNYMYNQKYPVLQIFLVPMAMLALMIMLFSAARSAESAGAAEGIITALDRAYLGSIVAFIIVMFTASYSVVMLAIQIYKESHDNVITR
jgi:hypothetical protein